MQKLSKQYHNNIRTIIILLDIIVVCIPTLMGISTIQQTTRNLIQRDYTIFIVYRDIT